MCPYSYILLLHDLCGHLTDLTSAADDPWYDTDSFREYDCTFCYHLEDLSCEYSAIEREYKCKSNSICRMAVINNSDVSVSLFADLKVHKV